jgi:hypothetical protein
MCDLSKKRAERNDRCFLFLSALDGKKKIGRKKREKRENSFEIWIDDERFIDYASLFPGRTACECLQPC